MKEGTLIRFDWAIKRLLRNKANFVILEGFLSELLNDDIKIETILESESNQETGDNKYNRVDMMVRNIKGEILIIEFQSSRMSDYLMRMLYGTSKVVVDNMDLGMGYNEIKKIISVNIVYFDLGQGEDYIYRGTTQFVGMHKKDILSLSPNEQKVYHTEQIAKIYPEYYIIKVNNFNKIAISGIDEWVYLFKNSAIKDNFNAKGIRAAVNTLNILNLTREQKLEYDYFLKDWRDFNSITTTNFEAGKEAGKEEGREEGRVVGREEGIVEGKKEGRVEGITAGKKEGKTEGIEEGKKEIAKEMKLNGFSIDVISKLSGLSHQDIDML